MWPWGKKLSGTQFWILQTVLAQDQDISLKSLPKHHLGGTWEASAISTRNISQFTISSETQIIVTSAIAFRLNARVILIQGQTVKLFSQKIFVLEEEEEARPRPPLDLGRPTLNLNWAKLHLPPHLSDYTTNHFKLNSTAWDKEWREWKSGFVYWCFVWLMPNTFKSGPVQSRILFIDRWM